MLLHLPYFQVVPHFEQEEAGPPGKWAVEVLILVLLLSWEPASCFVRLETVLEEKNKERDREHGRFNKVIVILPLLSLRAGLCSMFNKVQTDQSAM